MADPDPDMPQPADERYTPRWIFEGMGLEFDLDVAAPVQPSERRTPAKRYLTVHDDGPGIPGDLLPHITERFTRTAKDRLRYAFKVSAPASWDAPWGGEYEFHPLKGELYEYACAEGNYALVHMLAGARQEEKAKAAPKAGS